MDDDDLLGEARPLPAATIHPPPRLPCLQALAPAPVRLPVPPPPQSPPLAAPILEYIISAVRFTPLLEPPDRIPSARLSLPLTPNERWHFLEFRHGLALLNRTRLELTVWDPVTGGQRRFAVPPGFDTQDARGIARCAALLRDDKKKQAFRVVLLRHDDMPRDDDPQVFASVYESETGVWGGLISASITAPLWLGKPSILILRMADNRLGLGILTDQSIQLSVRKEGSGGVPRILQKTVQMDNLLSLPTESKWLVIMGYDEDGHVIFIWTSIGVFMIQLESLQFRNIFKTNIINTYHPFACFYTTGRGIGCV